MVILWQNLDRRLHNPTDGKGSDLPGTPVEEVKEIVEGVIEDSKVTEIKQFIEKHKVNSDNQLSELQKSVAETQDFYEKLEPFTSKIKDLNNTLSHYNGSLELDEEERKNTGKQNKLLIAISDFKNKALIKARNVRYIGEMFVGMGEEIVGHMTQTTTEKLGREGLEKLIEEYKEVRDSFVPLYDIFEEKYNSLLEEKKDLEEKVKLIEAYLIDDNITNRDVKQLNLIKTNFEEQLLTINAFLQLSNNNAKSYKEMSALLLFRFPQELNQLMATLPSIELSETVQATFKSLKNVTDLNTNLTKQAFESGQKTEKIMRDALHLVDESKAERYKIIGTLLKAIQDETKTPKIEHNKADLAKQELEKILNLSNLLENKD